MILGDIQLLPLGIYLKKEKALVISDIHIGFEHFLNRQGISLPWNSYPQIKEEILKYIAQVNPEKVVINGDLKEYLVSLSFQESNEIEDLIDTLQARDIEVIFVRGNHDNFILQTLENKGVKCYEQFLELNESFITHGHIKLEKEIAASKAKRVIIGHEHATVLIEDSAGARHKFKVIAEANLADKKVFVLPAFSPLKTGCELNIKKQSFLSPILKNASSFQYHLFEDNEWFTFNHEDIL